MNSLFELIYRRIYTNTDHAETIVADIDCDQRWCRSHSSNRPDAHWKSVISQLQHTIVCQGRRRLYNCRGCNCDKRHQLYRHSRLLTARLQHAITPVRVPVSSLATLSTRDSIVLPITPAMRVVYHRNILVHRDSHFLHCVIRLLPIGTRIRPVFVSLPCAMLAI